MERARDARQATFDALFSRGTGWNTNRFGRLVAGVTRQVTPRGLRRPREQDKGARDLGGRGSSQRDRLR
eukprot:6125348-Pyramimonas_sp.AAC.1